jgi:hypothetical protein
MSKLNNSLRLPLVRCAAVFAVSILAMSCSNGRGVPVDSSKARDAMRRTMESWKNGDAVDALQSRSPKIVVQDLDWLAGFKLVDFELIGDGTVRDTQFRYPVRLSLRDPDGKETTKQVAYVISTNPVITVFREIAL